MAQRLVEKLWEDLQASPKSLSKITKAAGVNPNYPRLQKSKGTMDLLRFCCLVHSTGQDLPTFISRALDSLPQGDLIERPQGQAPAIVAKARARVSDDQAGTIGRAHLERLDALRYDDPNKARERVEIAIEDVEREDVPLALGVYASCCRYLSAYPMAWHAISVGLDLVREVGNAWAEANLYQRASLVHYSLAAYERALATSEHAMALYARLGLLPYVGQTLVDQGSFLGMLNRHREAEAAFAHSLPLLAANDLRNQCAARHALSRQLHLRGHNEEALRLLDAARPMAASRMAHGQIHWGKGASLAALGRLEEAEEAFEKAFELISQVSTVDAALVVCDHVEALLEADQIAGAYEKAKPMLQLLEPLHDRSSIAAVAATDLARAMQEGGRKLTLQLVRRVKTKIEESRQAKARRP